MAITQYDITRWEEYIESGNRAGFYYEYYLETQQYQALVQASITSYSGALGGMALMGNYMAKVDDEQHYNLTLDEFSKKIAQATLDGIKSRLIVLESGFIETSEMVDIDHGVWDSLSLGDLFPGNVQFLLTADDWQTRLEIGLQSGGSENVFDAVYSSAFSEFNAWELGTRANDFGAGYTETTEDGILLVREDATGAIVFVHDTDINRYESFGFAFLDLLVNDNDDLINSLDPNSAQYDAREALSQYLQANRHPPETFVHNVVPPRVLWADELDSGTDLTGSRNYAHEVLNKLDSLDSNDNSDNTKKFQGVSQLDI